MTNKNKFLKKNILQNILIGTGLMTCAAATINTASAVRPTELQYGIGYDGTDFGANSAWGAAGGGAAAAADAGAGGDAARVTNLTGIIAPAAGLPAGISAGQTFVRTFDNADYSAHVNFINSATITPAGNRNYSVNYDNADLTNNSGIVSRITATDAKVGQIIFNATKGRALTFGAVTIGQYDDFNALGGIAGLGGNVRINFGDEESQKLIFTNNTVGSESVIWLNDVASAIHGGGANANKGGHIHVSKDHALVFAGRNAASGLVGATNVLNLVQIDEGAKLRIISDNDKSITIKAEQIKFAHESAELQIGGSVAGADNKSGHLVLLQTTKLGAAAAAAGDFKGKVKFMGNSADELAIEFNVAVGGGNVDVYADTFTTQTAGKGKIIRSVDQNGHVNFVNNIKIGTEANPLEGLHIANATNDTNRGFIFAEGGAVYIHNITSHIAGGVGGVIKLEAGKNLLLSSGTGNTALRIGTNAVKLHSIDVGANATLELGGLVKIEGLGADGFTGAGKVNVLKKVEATAVTFANNMNVGIAEAGELTFHGDSTQGEGVKFNALTADKGKIIIKSTAAAAAATLKVTSAASTGAIGASDKMLEELVLNTEAGANATFIVTAIAGHEYNVYTKKITSIGNKNSTIAMTGANAGTLKLHAKEIGADANRINLSFADVGHTIDFATPDAKVYLSDANNLAGVAGVAGVVQLHGNAELNVKSFGNALGGIKFININDAKPVDVSINTYADIKSPIAVGDKSLAGNTLTITNKHNAVINTSKVISFEGNVGTLVLKGNNITFNDPGHLLGDSVKVKVRLDADNNIADLSKLNSNAHRQFTIEKGQLVLGPANSAKVNFAGDGDKTVLTLTDVDVNDMGVTAEQDGNGTVKIDSNITSRVSFGAQDKKLGALEIIAAKILTLNTDTQIHVNKLTGAGSLTFGTGNISVAFDSIGENNKVFEVITLGNNANGSISAKDAYVKSTIIKQDARLTLATQNWTGDITGVVGNTNNTLIIKSLTSNTAADNSDNTSATQETINFTSKIDGAENLGIKNAIVDTDKTVIFTFNKTGNDNTHGDFKKRLDIANMSWTFKQDGGAVVIKDEQTADDANAIKFSSISNAVSSNGGAVKATFYLPRYLTIDSINTNHHFAALGVSNDQTITVNDGVNVGSGLTLKTYEQYKGHVKVNGRNSLVNIGSQSKEFKTVKFTNVADNYSVDYGVYAQDLTVEGDTSVGNNTLTFKNAHADKLNISSVKDTVVLTGTSSVKNVQGSGHLMVKELKDHNSLNHFDTAKELESVTFENSTVNIDKEISGKKIVAKNTTFNTLANDVTIGNSAGTTMFTNTTFDAKDKNMTINNATFEQNVTLKTTTNGKIILKGNVDLSKLDPLKGKLRATVVDFSKKAKGDALKQFDVTGAKPTDTSKWETLFGADGETFVVAGQGTVKAKYETVKQEGSETGVTELKFAGYTIVEVDKQAAAEEKAQAAAAEVASKAAPAPNSDEGKALIKDATDLISNLQAKLKDVKDGKNGKDGKDAATTDVAKAAESTLKFTQEVLSAGGQVSTNYAQLLKTVKKEDPQKTAKAIEDFNNKIFGTEGNSAAKVTGTVVSETLKNVGNVAQARMAGIAAGGAISSGEGDAVSIAGYAQGYGFMGSSKKELMKGDYTGMGVMVGVDAAFDTSSLVGAAFHFGCSKFEGKETQIKELKTQTLGGSLYAYHAMDNGLFVEGVGNIGMGSGEYSANKPGGTEKEPKLAKAELKFTAVSVSAKAGYNVKMDATTVSPYAGIVWQYTSTDKISEKDSLYNLNFAAKDDHTAAVQAGVKLSNAMKMSDTTEMTPFVDLAGQYVLGKDKKDPAKFSFEGSQKELSRGGTTTEEAHWVFTPRLGVTVNMGSFEAQVAGYGSMSSQATIGGVSLKLKVGF